LQVSILSSSDFDKLLTIFREVKTHLQPKYPNVAYFPDRFVIVVSSAILAWYFDWPSHGVEVLGDVRASGSLFRLHWPFRTPNIQHASDAFSTSFVIALLGFFESSVAAKSLGVGNKYGSEAIKMTLSPNREMVALGTANVVGGLFMAVPAFGGYGRSKVNASTGGKTPLSSIFLSLITIFCIFFVTPYFYYLPVSQTLQCLSIA
jgi:MFS superfamily sulfate permease-like transporter